MERLNVGDAAPDFALQDHLCSPLRLSELCKTRNVLLVFNIGFY